MASVMKYFSLRNLLVCILLLAGIFKIIGCVNMGQSIDPVTRTWFDEHRWSNRILVLTGDTQTINKQISEFNGLDNELEDRNLIIFDASQNHIAFGNAESLPKRVGTQKRFGLPENGYQMALVGKDGGVKRRYKEVVKPQEIFDCIDAMPMRIAEMKGNENLDQTVEEKQSKVRMMFDFSDLNDSSSWFILLDGVMGGKSTGNLEKTENTIVFTGTTSLKNNGGFSSMQSSIHPSSMDGMNAIEVKLKGDGREWIIASRKFTTPTADDYWYKFETTGDWQEITIPVKKMKRRVYGFPMIGSITPEQMKGLSFYIYDKNAGDFKLEIESIKAFIQ